MYTVGSWFPFLMNMAILAIVAVAIFGIMLYYRSRYDKESRGGILADIWLPNGKSFAKLVKPKVDGWIHILKGDYRLSVSRVFCECGHEEAHHEMDETKNIKCVAVDCDCKEFKAATVIPNVRRTAKYPARPFLGLRVLQVDVRTEAWYLNNPEPITPPDSRVYVTALDAYVHTREMTADQNAANIAEGEARQRRWEEMVQKLPDKMVLYIGLGAAVLVGIINLVQYVTGG